MKYLDITMLIITLFLCIYIGVTIILHLKTSAVSVKCSQRNKYTLHWIRLPVATDCRVVSCYAILFMTGTISNSSLSQLKKVKFYCSHNMSHIQWSLNRYEFSNFVGISYKKIRHLIWKLVKGTDIRTNKRWSILIQLGKSSHYFFSFYLYRRHYNITHIDKCSFRKM